MRTKRFSEWVTEHDEIRAKLGRLVAGLPKPYRRGRSRSADEAQLLRDRRTPDHLIGPVEPAVQQVEDPLGEFAGGSNADPVGDIDEFLYGPSAKP